MLTKSATPDQLTPAISLGGEIVDPIVLADLLPLQVWTARTDGELDFVNQRVVDYFGRTHAEMIGSGWQNVLHPDDLAPTLDRWQKALQTGQGYEVEFRLRRADGVYHWHLGRALPVRNAAGQIIKWFGTSMDVDQQRGYADLLVKLRELAVSAADADGPEGVFQVALEQVCSFMRWPIGHVYLLDADRGDLAPSEIWHVVAGMDVTNFQRVTRATRLKSGEGLPGRVYASKQPAWIPDATQDSNFPRASHAEDLGVRAAFGFPIVCENVVVAVLEFFSDQAAPPDELFLAVMATVGSQLGRVFERKRAEGQLRAQAAQLERANKDLAARTEEAETARRDAEVANAAKGQFLAVMSHELRTPINAIMGYADLLEAEVAGPLTDAQRDHLKRVRSGANHLRDLVDQVLSLARLEARREQVHLGNTDVLALASDVCHLVLPLAERRALRLDVDLPLQPIELLTDAGKLRQILLNLLGNALKFTEEGEVELQVTATEEIVRFSVRDTGIGIASEDVERVFNPFEQVSSPFTRKHGGTGLGLSVSRELARLLGGDLTVKSTPGTGSCFTVWLPRTRGA